MIAYIIRRLLQLIIVLFGVTLITFGMLKLVPGDPAVALAGKGATPEKIAFVRHERGLDRPFYIQYVKYLERLVHGDLGESLYTARPVAEMIREAAPVTIQLAVAAVLIELLGIPLGVYSALRQYSFWDTTLTTAALILWGIPVFVLGYFAMYIFGLKLNWLPIGGAAGPLCSGIIPSSWESFTDAHPAGAHAGPHRGRLHLLHAARLDARGLALGLHPHRPRQGPERA